jgi:hypothetical protein
VIITAASGRHGRRSSSSADRSIIVVEAGRLFDFENRETRQRSWTTAKTTGR